MAKSQAKKDKEFWDMVDQCVARSKARRKLPASKTEWREKYITASRLDDRNIPSMSNNIYGNCFKHDVADTRWKRPYRDNEELENREKLAQQELDNKKKKISIAYNKGPAMYVPDDRDAACNGRRPKAY